MSTRAKTLAHVKNTGHEHILTSSARKIVLWKIDKHVENADDPEEELVVGTHLSCNKI